jgi:hypothetical protein
MSKRKPIKKKIIRIKKPKKKTKSKILKKKNFENGELVIKVSKLWSKKAYANKNS